MRTRKAQDRMTRIAPRRRNLVVLVYIVLSISTSLMAQQKGQYQPGEYGLNAGVLPDPGITYADFNLNYSAGPPGSFASQTRRSAVQVPSQTEE